MAMNKEGMQVNLIDGPDPDFQDHGNSAEVRNSVLRTPQCIGMRSFFFLLLLMLPVVTSVESKNSFVQELTSGFTEAHILRICSYVTELISEVKTLRNEKHELEEVSSQLRAKIARLESSASTPVEVTQSPPVEMTANDSCPSKWHHFNGSCYFISRYVESWQDSQKFCKQKGGHLAIIHTAEEQSFIWNLLPRGHWNAFWIGVTDEKVEGDWYWVDETKLVGSFWEDGEPNNDMNEDCGNMVKTLNVSRIATKSWYDAPCEMSRYWICEKEI